MKFDPVLVIFLERTDGTKVKDNFPKYYKYNYERNPEKLLEKSLNNNYLKESNYKYNMYQTTNKKLKNALRNFDLKVSGVKKELVERLLRNIKEEKLKSIFDDPYYQLTDKGNELVNNNKHLIYYHKNQNLHNLSISRYHNMVSNKGLNKHKAAIELFNESANHSKRKKDWGIYRNKLLYISEVYRDMSNNKKRLEYLLKVCHIDLSGLSNNNTYMPGTIILAPGIISKIENNLFALEYNEEEIKNLYYSTISEFNLPKKRYSNQKTVQYIIEALDKGVDNVNEKIKKENEDKDYELLDEKYEELTNEDINSAEVSATKEAGTNVNEKFSQEWDQCPRCGSNNVKHHETGLIANIFATMGCGGALTIALSFLFPPALFILVPAVIIAGIINVKGPEFECEECGATWDKEDNANKNKDKTNALGKDESNKSQNKYLKKIGIGALAFFLPPVGIFFIYKSGLFSKVGKTISVIWTAMFVLSLVFG